MTPQKVFCLLLLLAFSLVVLAFASYYDRYPTSDDAWFAEESYWLLHDGKVRSEFFSGLLGWEKHYLASHKLFILIGALFIKLFPDSLFGVKLTGLLFFMVLVTLLITDVWHQKKSAEDFKMKALIVLILLFGNTLIVKMSFENRPEMMVTTLGLCSFLLLKSPSIQAIIWAGILAGLAVLTHLNGVIFIAAGFLLLMLTKNYSKAFLFVCFAALVSCLYFYDVWQVSNGIETWWFQFRNDPATQKSFSIQSKIKVLLSFPLIFVESPEQQALTALLLILLWVQRRTLVTRNKTLVIYTFCLLFSFWVLTKSATAIYQMLFIPMMILLVIELLPPINTSYKTPLILKIGMTFYLIVGVVGNSQIISKNINYNPDRYALFRSKITDPTKGVVPLTFFFNEYSRYPKLLCHTNYHLQRIASASTNVAGFFEWAKRNKVTFVLFDYENDYAEHYPNPRALQIKGYNRIYFDGELALYEYKK